MEEDEEELYSEMQLEEGGRRRSITSHSALKVRAVPPTFPGKPALTRGWTYPSSQSCLTDITKRTDERANPLYTGASNGIAFRKISSSRFSTLSSKRLLLPILSCFYGCLDTSGKRQLPGEGERVLLLAVQYYRAVCSSDHLLVFVWGGFQNKIVFSFQFFVRSHLISGGCH